MSISHTDNILWLIRLVQHFTLTSNDICMVSPNIMAFHVPNRWFRIRKPRLNHRKVLLMSTTVNLFRTNMGNTPIVPTCTSMLQHLLLFPWP